MAKFDVTTIHVDSRAAHTIRVSAANEDEAKTKAERTEDFPEGETEVEVAKA